MILLLTLGLTLQADAQINAGQFLQIMSELHSDVRDVELICEGKFLRLVDNEGRPRSEPELHVTYQSNYAYRYDGATYWQLYRKEHRGAEPNSYIMTGAALGGELLERTSAFDQGPGVPVRSRKGGASSLNYDGSPGRFYHKYRWDDLASKGDHSGYRFEGWELVDGQKCLRVAIHSTPGHEDGAGRIHRYWIDLNRGGQTLKHELYRGGSGPMSGLWARLSDVKLAEFDLGGGRRTWFPVRAVVETFVRGMNDVRPYPVFRQDYGVVQGTVRFNRNLPDSRFSIDWEPPGRGAPGTMALREEFKSIEPTPSPPAQPTDPASVQEDLERRLAEAERQARMLDASPPSARAWNGTTITQLVIGAGGIAAIVVAMILRRRA